MFQTGTITRSRHEDTWFKLGGTKGIATTGQVVYPHCMYNGQFILSKPAFLKQKFPVVEF
jgi:hypothetical protein